MSTRRASGRASLRIERQLWGEGVGYIAGVDEVGKGAWAGPLTVGVAVLPADRRLYRVNDSKQLTEKRREALYDRVAQWCAAWAVGHASAAECDELGMSDAQRLATTRAFDQLGVTPEVLLVDGKWNFIPGPIAEAAEVRMLVRGDSTSLSIAAASILAKVTRDRIMRDAASHMPSYWWEHNKGYPCSRHKAALRGYGPSALHRRSWAFMDSLPWPGLHRPPAEPDDAQLSLFDVAS